jgi:hypothetical protein
MGLQPAFVLAQVLKRFTIPAAILAFSALASSQQITVDITPGHATNSISPMQAFGAGIDRDPYNSVKTIFSPSEVQKMLTAGWGPISYRLNTELSIQAWHWNPTGQWSDPKGKGYFVGDANSSGSIKRSFGYNLPHRGTTENYGTGGGYSVLNDGDLKTYWKSNPYLDEKYTGEDNSLHPGFILVDLGDRISVNAIKIAWANPYAVNYQVQYWTGNYAIDDPGNGNWVNFADGVVTGAQGGIVTLQLAKFTRNVEYVRVLMTASSNTCDTHGSADPRNCVGFAVNEVYLGSLDSTGAFTDLMTHSPDENQTDTYGSSVDPWHEPNQLAKYDGEQPGFDLVFNSGLTRGLPMTIPVAMLYDNPDNAANEIAYIESKGYPIKYVEMGEEPDGQFVFPEDDAALYIQFANAIHKVDPSLKLAGPVFEGATDDIPVWPDAHGNTSWLNRFLNYLKNHGHIDDLNVMTFEHYPFDPCNIRWDNLYQEPYFVNHIMSVWRKDGLPANVPMEITESNIAYDTATQYMQPFGALFLADYAGSFLTAGGQALYYYQWEPLPMYQGCGGWGTFGMFQVDSQYRILQETSQFFAAQMLTQQWAQPIDQIHTIYPASTDIKDGNGNVLVTAYSILRPDNQWSLLLVNKDQSNSHTVTVDFRDLSLHHHRYFHGDVTQISFGLDNYRWHGDGQNGFAQPDGPAITSTQSSGKAAEYILPKSSITVLRGKIQ